ncbi:MAG TPA: malto-oligosyltrehalose trehalohydrolase [Polyangiaceae bacterium]|nr:malto-oligosyltrehalose trehalohydrolase [Polyangiaceae bacterium]
MTHGRATGQPRLGAHPEGESVRFAAFTTAEACALRLVDAAGERLAEVDMTPRGDGYFEVSVPGISHGALYWFVVNGKALPDPYARWLPHGVHGPASVVVPRYAPRHLPPVRPLSEQVIYELHIGTFTEQGTFEAARRRLPALVELGVTTIELMPIAAFAGERGWGYDGVAWYAPHAAYGTPDELRELVDAAHGLGLLVLLDVVYNHFGPSGNYLAQYAESYFSSEFENAWGKAPNFGDPALRALVVENARYWLRELGFDGLRLDATHTLFDPSPKHVLVELAEIAHEPSPHQLLIAEDERNEAALVTLLGLDAVWADDFHHQIRVSLTQERQGYYADFEPSAAGVAAVINRGWLFTGQRRPSSGRARGGPADELPASAFVYCIQNHDQIGNRALGDRLSSFVSTEAYRAASLLLLFLPMTPLLFMGQEWAARTPFLYFTDHDAELGERIRAGRRREFSAFPELEGPAARERIPDPQALATFQMSKLRWDERELTEHRETLELYQQAIALRRTDEVLANSGREELLAVVSSDVLMVHRWCGNARRVLVMNFGSDAVELESIAAELRLRNGRALLKSSTDVGAVLPPRGAILLSGAGNLAGLLESER